MSRQHAFVTGTNSIMSAFDDRANAITGLDLDNDNDNSSGYTGAPQPTIIEPGVVCQVNGLQSTSGKALNGRRCAVLRYVEDEGRFEVRMENETGGPNKTWALKEGNLELLPKLSLPTHSSRGQLSTPRSMCELLLYYKGSGPVSKPIFTPSTIVLKGYSADKLNAIPDKYLGRMVGCQLEQMAGVLGLASFCQDYEEHGAEQVLFSFLEGDQMYADVLIQTIHWTGLIESDDDENDTFSRSFSNTPPTKLTPDQNSQYYVRFMSTGPLRLLVEMTKYKFGTAMWDLLKKSEFYHLFVQRLLRLIGRETLKTADGLKLGPMARKILLKVTPGVNLDKPILSRIVAKDMLIQTNSSPCRFIGPDDEITANIINTKFLLGPDEESALV